MSRNFVLWQLAVATTSGEILEASRTYFDYFVKVQRFTTVQESHAQLASVCSDANHDCPNPFPVDIRRPCGEFECWAIDTLPTACVTTVASGRGERDTQVSVTTIVVHTIWQFL